MGERRGLKLFLFIGILLTEKKTSAAAKGSSSPNSNRQKNKNEGKKSTDIIRSSIFCFQEKQSGRLFKTHNRNNIRGTKT